MILSTIGAACSMLGCSPDDLAELVERDILMPVKLGERIRFYTHHIETLQDWFDSAYYVDGESDDE
jgi:hypothetical protein